MTQVLVALILIATCAYLFAALATRGGWKRAVATWVFTIVMAALVVVTVGLVVGAL